MRTLPGLCNGCPCFMFWWYNSILLAVCQALFAKIFKFFLYCHFAGWNSQTYIYIIWLSVLAFWMVKIDWYNYYNIVIWAKIWTVKKNYLAAVAILEKIENQKIFSFPIMQNQRIKQKFYCFCKSFFCAFIDLWPVKAQYMGVCLHLQKSLQSRKCWYVFTFTLNLFKNIHFLITPITPQ